MARVLARLAATLGQLAMAPLAGVVCAAAAAAFDWPHWAGDVHGDYYVVVASIIPVLLLALMLEVATSLPVDAISARIHTAVDKAIEMVDEIVEVIEDEAEAERHRLSITRDLQRIRGKHIGRMTPTVGRLRWTVRGFFICAVAGETVSLYAVAAEDSTQFTFVLATVHTFTLVVMLARAFELRFALD